MPEPHICIDCRRESNPGKPRKIATGDGETPRCLSHLRRFKTHTRQLKRAAHVERTYDISARDAGELLVYQDGKCWICRQATGATKALAVDHDHADDWPRGRLCGECNQFIGRRLGDDPQAAQRLVNYLSGDTPYRRMLAMRVIREFHPDAVIDGVRVLVFEGGPHVEIGFASGGVWNVISTTLKTLQGFATPKA